MSKINTIIETQALALMVQSQDLNLIRRHNIKAEDFIPSISKVINFMETYEDKYGTLPSEQTIISNFPEEYDPIRITDSPLYIAEELEAHIKTKHFLTGLQEYAKELTSGNAYSKQESLQEIEELLHQVKESVGAKDKGGRVEATDEARIQEYIDKVTGKILPPIRTMIEPLDKVIQGILPTDLVVLYARPGHGKSYIGTLLASNLAKQSKRVVMYSGEMPAAEVLYRFDTIRTGMSNRALTYGAGKDLVSREEYQAYLDNLKEEQGSLVILEQEFFGGMPTVSDLRRAMANEKGDVLIVDQLSLMRSTSKTKEERVKFKEIVQGLRNLALEMKRPIILLAQANREATQKDDNGQWQIPKLHHLAEADAVGQFATKALGMVAVKQEGTNTAIVKIQAEKNRSGGNEYATLVLDYDRGEWTAYDENTQNILLETPTGSTDGNPVAKVNF